jgi:transposase
LTYPAVDTAAPSTNGEPPSSVPSPEQEDARRLHRERDRLIAERVAHVNQHVADTT